MNRTRLIAAVLTAQLLLTSVSCSVSKPARLPENSSTVTSDSVTTEPKEPDEKVISILNEIVSQNASGQKGVNQETSLKSMFVDSVYVHALYDLAGGSNGHSLVELNPETGRFRPICRDPLCNHLEDSCCMSGLYIAYTIADEKIFAHCGTSVELLDVKEGKRTTICRWKNSNAWCCNIVYDQGYIYFNAATSDDTNEMYRFPATIDKPEQISKLNDNMVVFTISDGKIMFRNKNRTLKCAKTDFSDVTTIGEKATVMLSDNGRFFFFEEEPMVDYIYRATLLEADVDNKKVKGKLTGDILGADIFLQDGVFYYAKSAFAETQEIYTYDLETNTESLLLTLDLPDKYTQIWVFGVYGDYLLLQLLLDDSRYGTNKYFFVKKDGSVSAEIGFEGFM